MFGIEKLFEKNPPFAGFRISATDGIVLVGGLLGCYALYAVSYDVTVILATVILHFFLFCNIFRVHRNLELMWGGIFVLNTLCWALLTTTGEIPWFSILASQSLITSTIIGFTISSSRYHGILWKKFNPTLTGWGYVDGVSLKEQNASS